jgi:hypothetical protein
VAASTRAGSEHRTPATPAPAPSSTAPSCTNGEQSALAELGCELSKGLGPLPGDVVVAAGAPSSDRALSRAPELATRLARFVARSIGPRAASVAGASTLAEAEARSPSAGLVVFVVAEIVGGEIRVTADAFPVTRSFWDRVRGVGAGPVAHAFAMRRLDGEIATFLPRVPLVAGHVDKGSLQTSDVVALACGDVDGDGALEIVAIGRRRIQLGRIRQGRFVSVAEALWPSLSPVAPSPLRDPIGSAAIAPGRYVDVGITDRASGLRLGPSLDRIRKLDEILPWTGVGCLGRSGVAVGLPGPCARGERPLLDVGEVAETDAIASGRVVNGEGQSILVAAYRERASGKAILRDDRGRTAEVPGAGAEIAVGDLDLDGQPEFVSSSDTLNPAEDALVVRSWGKDGAIRERFRLPAPEGIHAVAVCPPEDARMAPIVLATGASVWVVR